MSHIINKVSLHSGTVMKMSNEALAILKEMAAGRGKKQGRARRTASRNRKKRASRGNARHEMAVVLIGIFPI